MMPRIRTMAGLSVIVAGTLWTGSMGARAQEKPAAELAPIWKGAYTAAQAEGGKVPFTGLCRRCHSDTLLGSERGPALKGESFLEHWEQQDLDRLRSKIRDTMPPDDPGKLSEEEYLGLVSYIIQNNGYPAGSTPLDSAALSGVQVVRKPGEERPLRSFSVVQVVGCLVQERGAHVAAGAGHRAGADPRTRVDPRRAESRGGPSAGCPHVRAREPVVDGRRAPGTEGRGEGTALQVRHDEPGECEFAAGCRRELQLGLRAKD